MTKEEQLQALIDRYLSVFLGFAISKTGNITEAEELTQEIAYQAIIAVNRGNIQKNFHAYIWSIAHNTFKRWCKRKKPLPLDEEVDTFSNIVSNDIPAIEQIIYEEDMNGIRLALSRLTSDYRKIIVCFYFDELSISEIGKRLSLSEGMVKFYLRAGKQKLREAFDMNHIGEKSFNPSEFSIYKSSVDFSKVNVWEVFKRKLPCQIAIICHDDSKTISDIAFETGTPAVYIEDEVKLLLDAGVMINPVKGKFRTNFHVMKENTALQIKEQFTQLFESYVPFVVNTYEKYLPDLKKCDVFKFDATSNQWAWYYAGNIPDFYYDGYDLTADDYPQILSCGSKAFIFAQATEGSKWACGHTPTFLEKCDVHPCDVVAFGEYRHQRELREVNKAQALYDVYCGIFNESDKELYAELIEQCYVIKVDGKLLCNVAVTTQDSQKLFETINAELLAELQSLCGKIRENVNQIVKKTIPEQLKDYTKGYTEKWISFYAGVYLYEALYNKGFLSLKEKEDRTPVSCWIYEK